MLTYPDLSVRMQGFLGTWDLQNKAILLEGTMVQQIDTKKRQGTTRVGHCVTYPESLPLSFSYLLLRGSHKGPMGVEMPVFHRIHVRTCTPFATKQKRLPCRVRGTGMGHKLEIGFDPTEHGP